MVAKNKGFTLIEILVASVILFSAISVVTLIFKSSYVASQKAQLKVEQTGIVSVLLKKVQQEIRDKTTYSSDKLEGEGVIWGKKYQWHAILLEFKAPIDKFDNETGTTDKFDEKYKLWQVDLVIGTGKSIEKSIVEYQYNEISWVK